MQPIVLVTIDVRPATLAGFLALVEHHARQSRLEPGCLRFDVLRDLHHPNRFTLHEVFTDGRAVDEHRRTPHYLHWRGEIGQYEEAHHRSSNEVIDGGAVVFTNGCFDLLHRGHLSLLQEARAQGGRLVVAVNTDASARRLKGPGRPVVPLIDRLDLLRALKCVNEVVSFDTEAELLGLIRMIAPDVLVKGDHGAEVVGADIVEDAGGRVHLVPLREGRSTTRLLERVRAG